MATDAVVEQLVADAYERKFPTLTPRTVRLPWVRGKADAIVGMRRSGKTSLALHKAAELVAAGRPRESVLYVNFDDERFADFEAQDLGRLLDAYFRRWPRMREVECSLFFDEIQNVPGWERFIRRVIDTENAHVYVTGSSAKLLSTEIATSLRGRALTTEVFPFSILESLAHAGIDATPTRPGKALRARVEHHVDRYVHVGGFPEAQGVDERVRIALLQSYLDVVVLRDVVERHAIANVTALRRFVRQVMNSPGGRVSVNRTYNDLRSQGVAVSKDGLHAYMDHLSDAFFWCPVAIHSDSERVRQSNPKKVYCIDPGLVTACVAKASTDVGFLLETTVFLALRRQNASIAYGRTSSGREIDFVVHGRGETSLVQACADLRDGETRRREIEATEEGMREFGVRHATIVTLREESQVRTRAGTIRVVPLWLWSLERGDSPHTV